MQCAAGTELWHHTILAHLPGPEHVVVLLGARQRGVLLEQEVEPLRALPDACAAGALSDAAAAQPTQRLEPWEARLAGRPARWWRKAAALHAADQKALLKARVAGRTLEHRAQLQPRRVAAPPVKDVVVVVHVDLRSRIARTASACQMCPGGGAVTSHTDLHVTCKHRRKHQAPLHGLGTCGMLASASARLRFDAMCVR